MSSGIPPECRFICKDFYKMHPFCFLVENGLLENGSTPPFRFVPRLFLNGFQL